MKRMPTILIFFLVLFTMFVHSIPTLGQTDTFARQQINTLEKNVETLEEQQNNTIDSMKTRSEFYWGLIILLSGFAALLLGFQVYVGIVQQRREGKREQERDLVERAGIEQVSKIMNVVQQTLEGRLAAEKKASEQTEQAKKEYEKVVKPLEHFHLRFKIKIKKASERLEDAALQWASKWGRHDFRGKTRELDRFADQFDEFMEDSILLGDDEPFSSPARVFYIRGIAAHYANQPDIAKQNLEKVVQLQQQLPDEDTVKLNRRIANAYYYLGLIETNFGNKEGIAHFQEAEKRDLEHRDILTKVVIAEAYLAAGDFESAYRYVANIETMLGNIEREDGGLANSRLRWQSRTALIKSNIEIIKNSVDWGKTVRGWLESVHTKEPQYYYATATLAQAYAASNDFGEARDLFHEAYKAILSSNDLSTVNEIRSKILLLMTAGMCAKQSASKEEKLISKDYLDEADKLRDSLPKIGSDICTVFSLLSKKNENRDTIHHHIELIREDKILSK